MVQHQQSPRTNLNGHDHDDNRTDAMLNYFIEGKRKKLILCKQGHMYFLKLFLDEKCFEKRKS
jgi:hypothetical protein